jgi:hypothetical protein
MPAMVERRQEGHIWVLPGGDSGRAKQITSGEILETGVAAGPNGKILIRRGNGKMDLINADRTERAPFRDDSSNFIAFSECAIAT